MDSKTILSAQHGEQEILNEIKRVCEKNNIEFFLDAGTLLGAIRHGGFIPWDDDTDLGMDIKNYKRFIEIAPKELDKQYILKTWDSCDNFPYPFAKVEKVGTIYRERICPKNIDCGLWVDIFPYYRCKINDESEGNMVKNLMHINRIVMMKCKYKVWLTDNGLNMKKYIGYIPYRIISLFYSKKQLIDKYNIKLNDYLNRYNKNNYTDEERYFGLLGFNEIYRLKSSWFSAITYVNFNKQKFPVPVGWKDILKQLYGDYMTPPPESERYKGHSIVEIKF